MKNTDMKKLLFTVVMLLEINLLWTSKVYANIEEIDLSYLKIGSWNVEEKVSSALKISLSDLGPRDHKQIKLILSDNYLDDCGIKNLMKALNSDKRFLDNLCELDLSNNRITIEGARKLIPLLKQERFEWLNLCVGTIVRSEFDTFYEIIQRDYEGSCDDMARKVVWLPRDYHADRFFAYDDPYYKAHMKYYNLSVVE